MSSIGVGGGHILMRYYDCSSSISCAELGTAQPHLVCTNLLWELFEGLHYIIPLRHKWRACCQRMNPLASKFLVQEPNEISDVELEN